jgi:hypothetical protein
MEDIKNRIEKILQLEKAIKSKNDEIIFPKDIVYFTLSEGSCWAVTENGKEFELASSLAFYEKLLKDYFLKVHRAYLVSLDRIEGFYKRYPLEKEEDQEEVTRGKKVSDECELALRGTSKRIPVTDVYSNKLKKLFGLKNFSYLMPEHPHDKKLRLMGLIDFGWRELEALDADDLKAVENYKKKWDIKLFTQKRMLSYFRQYGAKILNKKRAIKNIIYQLFRWIKKGIEPKSDGNIRSLWYKVKTVLARHSNALTSSDVDTFYSTLQEMVEVEHLFRYKDFGFMDMNEPYRGIGAKFPEIVLASEKRGHYIFIRRLANEAGVSFVCMNGEPAVLSLEYFSDDLKRALEPEQENTNGSADADNTSMHRGKKRNKRDFEKSVSGKSLTVLCISDVDPAGYSIENSLVSGLRRNGHQVDKVVKLVDLSNFTDEEIEIVRYPVVSYELKDNNIIPVAPATMSQVTKGRQWWESLGCDKRLISEKTMADGRRVVTIYGIESDAADREQIKEKFLKEAGASFKRGKRYKL